MTSAEMPWPARLKKQIARFGARQALHEVLHQLEAAVVDGQRGERGEAHRHLHPAEQRARVRRALSTRRRTASPPSARPRMKVESISSKECVEAPSTSESMRIQQIS